MLLCESCSALMPLPPFTEKDAVHFATAGSGSVTDLFPDEAGTSNTVVEGYQVERETAVRQAGKEKYEVMFIERWSKAGISGENRMNYIITRGSLSANGGGGDELPYRR